MQIILLIKLVEVDYSHLHSITHRQGQGGRVKIWSENGLEFHIVLLKSQEQQKDIYCTPCLCVIQIGECATLEWFNLNYMDACRP